MPGGRATLEVAFEGRDFMAAPRGKKTPVPVELAPLVLIKGKEGLLIDRAMAALRAQAYEQDPNLERSDVQASNYQAGHLDVLTSPSLFGEARLILIPELEQMTGALADDLLAYLSSPAPDVWIIAIHPGGNAAGKKVVEAIAKAGFPVISAEEIKNDRDKLELIKEEVRSAHRRMNADAMQAIVDALGSDLRSMMAAVNQLLTDVEGNVTVEDVRRYHAGRIEASGFDVADAVIAGDAARALTLLRHAFATGVEGIPIVAAIAMKIRAMAKVSASGTGKGLGMAPWQIDRARRELRGWSDPSLAGAIKALALADEELKGASKDPQRAVEKAVITLCRLHSRP